MPEENPGTSLQYLLVDRIFTLAGQYTGQAIWAAATCFCIYRAGIALAAFAGKHSGWEVLLQIAANLNITIGASISVAGVTSLLYFLERRAHQRTKRVTSERMKHLERVIDPRQQ